METHREVSDRIERSLNFGRGLGEGRRERLAAARPVGPIKKAGSGATNVVVTGARGVGFPGAGVALAGAWRSAPACPQARSPAMRGVAPMPPVNRCCSTPSVEYTEFVAAGVALPAGGVRATSPARGTPHPGSPTPL